MIIEILGLVFSMVLGTIGHFLYNLTNENKIIGILFSKNESVIEHLKLGITPILLWTIIEFFTIKNNNLFFAKFISILTFIFVLLILYYGYKFLFKKNILFLDILIFYISLTIAYLVSISILLSCNASLLLNSISIFGLIGIIFSYLVLAKIK